MSRLGDNRQSLRQTDTTRDGYSLTEQDLWEQIWALAMFDFRSAFNTWLATYKNTATHVNAGEGYNVICKIWLILTYQTTVQSDSHSHLKRI